MQLIHSRPLEKIGAQLPIFLTGFFLICGLAVLLQQIGMPIAYISQLMLIVLLSVYFYSGISAATMSFDAYQNARRCISPFFNGQGLAAGMISMGVFVLLPGYFYANGTASLDYFSGWLLAVVIMTTTIASAYNNSKATTIPEFIFPSSEARWQRFVIMLIVLVISLLLLSANLAFIGELGARIFSIKSHYAIVMAGITIGCCLILGGIQGMTMARIFAYVILVSALLVPLVWTSAVLTGNPFPQYIFGAGAISPLLDIGRELVQNDLLLSEQNRTITAQLSEKELLPFFATMVCIACGLGVMPHLLQHFVVVETPSIARKTGFWAFASLLIVLSAVPAIAAFVHFEVFSVLVGLEVSELKEDLDWLFALSGAGNLPLISICGQIVDGYNDALAACGSVEHVLQPSDIALNPEFLLLGTASLHNLPLIMYALIGLGIMVALWSTADGLLLAAANTLSNDFYGNILRPRSPMSVRLFMTRFMLFAIIFITVVVAISIEFDNILLLESGIALSAAALFPGIIIKAWFGRAPQLVVILTMLSGFFAFAIAMAPEFHPIVSEFTKEYVTWNGIEPFIAGIYGLAASIVVGILSYLLSQISFKRKEKEHATVSN